MEFFEIEDVQLVLRRCLLSKLTRIILLGYIRLLLVTQIDDPHFIAVPLLHQFVGYSWHCASRSYLYQMYDTCASTNIISFLPALELHLWYVPCFISLLSGWQMQTQRVWKHHSQYKMLPILILEYSSRWFKEKTSNPFHPWADCDTRAQ